VTSHSYHECICVCGKTHHVTEDGEGWICSCGRPSILAAGIGYTEEQLIAMLNQLDIERDRVAKCIELRRDRAVA
jgi:hypothetical protein